MLEIILSFSISLLIGLLLGIERERSHPEGVQFMGVRTFTLLSLLGTLLATLNQLVLTTTASAFIFSLLLLSYFRSTSNQKKKIDSWIVTEISAGIIFCLGFMVPASPLIAITISAIVLLVLIERKRLHTLARKKFKPHEMEAVIILIVFALGLLPLLPNRTIDPWQLFNPRDFGLLLTTIAAIQFGGYVAIHLFGERLGIALTGFLGGLVSSTIVFTQIPNNLRTHPHFIPAILASGLLATIAMLVDIAVIVFVASPRLLNDIIWPIVTMIVVGILFVGVLLRYQKTKKQSPPHLSNPLNLLSVLRTSIYLGLMFVLIAVANRYISIDAILGLSFLGGLFEIHGISLATAVLYLGHQLSIIDARLVLYTAILASFVSKFSIIWSLTPFRFALQSSLFLLGLIFCGGIVFWFGF